MSLSASTTQLTSGSNVAVTVRIAAGVNQITAAQACVTYDATRLTKVSVDTATSKLGSTTPSDPTVNCDVNQIQISRYDTTPVSGDFILGVINFTVISTGSTPLDLTLSPKSYLRDNATTDTNGNYINVLTDTTNTTLTPPAVTLPPTSAPASSMDLTPATATINQGETVTVTVKVHAGTSQITVAQSCVSYDNTKFSVPVIDVSASPLQSAIPANGGKDCSVGQAQISRYDTTPATGDFTLGTMTFTAKVGGTTADLIIDQATSFVIDKVTTDSSGSYISILKTVKGSTITLNALAPPPVVVVPVYLSPATGSVTQGSVVHIGVVADAGTNQVDTAKICITFDATKLTLSSVDVSASPLHTNVATNSTDCTGVGKAKVSVTDTTPATGILQLGVLNFTALQSGVTTTLNIDSSASVIQANLSQVGILGAVTGSVLTLSAVAPEPITVSSSIANGLSLNGTINWTANTTGGGITKVEFSVDNTVKSTATTAPYQYSLDTTALTNGTHVFKVTAYNAGSTIADLSSATVTNGDTVVPSVPTALTATATAYNKVSLSWQASTDNVGIAGYWIVKDGTTIGKLGAVTSYENTGLTAGTTYQYQIIAQDLAGNFSALSVVKSVKTLSVPVDTTTPPSTTPPAPPSTSNGTTTPPKTNTSTQKNSTVYPTAKKPSSGSTTPIIIKNTVDSIAPSAPANVQAVVVSATQVNITWQQSTDNIGVTGYDIYRLTDGGTGYKYATIESTGFGDSILNASTSYSYYVVALDGIGNQSEKSAIASSKTSKKLLLGSLTGQIKSSDGKLLGTSAILVINGVKHAYGANASGVYAATKLPADTYDVTYSGNNGFAQSVKVVVTAQGLVINNVTIKKK